MHRWALALMLGGAVPAAAADLTGTWVAIKAEQNGAAAADLVGHRLAFEGQDFTIKSRDGNLVFSGSYAVDPAVKPPRIDFQVKAPQGVAWEGIYRLDGNRLVIVDDAPDPTRSRPTGFAAAAGSGYVMVEFERASP